MLERNWMVCQVVLKLLIPPLATARINVNEYIESSPFRPIHSRIIMLSDVVLKKGGNGH